MGHAGVSARALPFARVEGRRDAAAVQFSLSLAGTWLDGFSTYYEPTFKAFAALDEAATKSLRQDLGRLIESHNRASDGTMVVPSDSLEIVISR